MPRGRKTDEGPKPCFRNEALLIECVGSAVRVAIKKMQKRKSKKAMTETQKRRDTVLNAMLFVTALLTELQSNVPAQHQKDGLIRYSSGTKYKNLGMQADAPVFDEKHWEAFQSLKDPNNSIHPIFGPMHCGGRPTLYTCAFLLPVVGGVFGAAIGYWKASKAMKNAGIHEGIIAIMGIVFITTLIAELLDALCVASPIAPFVNSVVKPMDRISKVVELRLAVIWYFRIHPGEADNIARALGWDSTGGTLEAFLRGLGKLDLDMDMANAKASRSIV